MTAFGFEDDGDISAFGFEDDGDISAMSPELAEALWKVSLASETSEIRDLHLAPLINVLAEKGFAAESVIVSFIGAALGIGQGMNCLDLLVAHLKAAVGLAEKMRATVNKEETNEPAV